MWSRLLTNHPLVNIFFVVVVLMGLLSYVTMPREQDPEINFNWVNVNTVLPGASAENMEKLVTSPLEDSIRNVQDVRFVTSSSRESVSSILVRFRSISDRTYDKRVNDLRREIQNKANQELPQEAEDPMVLELTTSNGFPTAFVMVVGQSDNEYLRQQARFIKEDLEAIKGVDKVNASGLHDPEMHVEFDPYALASRGIRASDVADALTTAFRDTSAGSVQVADAQWLVRVEGTTADPEKLAQFNIVSKKGSQQPIRLSDVAEISRGREKATQLVSFNGRPAVSLAITKVSGINTINLVERLNQYMSDKNQQLNANGVELILADDQTVQTRNALSVMQRNALLGLLLVLAVCWLFLGIRIALMVTLGIVFSIAGTFWILNITGNTLNVSVLLGIVIVLGMLVDDAVVVVEAIYYRIQRGMSGLDASLGALGEVALPVTSAVMTTMAAFLPLMLLPGILGKFMFVIPFVVTLGLLVSLIEAFWILPAHVISLPGGTGQSKDKKVSRRVRVTRLLRLKYAKILCHIMRRPRRYLLLGLGVFLTAIGVMASGKIKTEFFIFDPIRLFYVNVDMPADASLQKTLKQTTAVEKIVRQFIEEKEIRAITSLAGIKFTETEPLYGDQYGQIQVSLNPKVKNGRSVSEIVNSMRAVILNTPGDAVLSFLEVSGGPPSGRPISVKVRGDDFVELRSATEAVKGLVMDIKGTRNITDNDVIGRSEMVLELDTENIQRLGLDPGLVLRLLRLHLDGEIVAFMQSTGEKIELRVRGIPRNRQDIETVLNDPVSLPSGDVVTFNTLFKKTVSKGRSTIRHYNLRRAITVEADIDRQAIDTKAVNEQLQAAWQPLRSEYPNTDLDFSGELDDIEESMNAMKGLFILGLGLIYLILATQLRSYFQPLLILLTVPMAFTGVIYGLWITGNPMSLYTMYGVIALTGIAVNGAIVLMDAANTRIRSGMRPLHATVYAARRRVVPIIMTTITTIAGLFSLAAGFGGKSLLWGPVASSIVFGLLVSATMTLFMMPVMYRYFMRNRYVNK